MVDNMDGSMNERAAIERERERERERVGALMISNPLH